MSETTKLTTTETHKRAKHPMAKALLTLTGLTTVAIAAMLLSGCGSTKTPSTYTVGSVDRAKLQLVTHDNMPFSPFTVPNKIIKLLQPKESAAQQARHDALEALIISTTNKILDYTPPGSAPNITIYAPNDYDFPTQERLDAEFDFIDKYICNTGTIYDKCNQPTESIVIVNDYGSPSADTFLVSLTWGTQGKTGTVINTNSEYLKLSPFNQLSTEACQLKHGLPRKISLNDQEAECNAYAGAVYAAEQNLSYAEYTPFATFSFEAPSGHIELTPYPETIYEEICQEVVHSPCSGTQFPVEVSPTPTPTNQSLTTIPQYGYCNATDSGFVNYSSNIPTATQVVAIAQ